MIKRALVTGANGLVGRGVVECLLRREIPTIATDCVNGSFDCPFLNIDVTQPGALDDVLTADTAVFHLAARTSVSGSVNSPVDDFRVNVQGTLEVLESIRRSGGSLVFSSSSAVYDPCSPLPHKETASRRPTSPYGQGKLACEGYCCSYHQCYGLDIRIVRLFNVYGPGMAQYAIHDFFRKIRDADDEIEILGDGLQVRDYLHVDDAGEGFLTVASSGKPGEIYNLASGQPTGILDLARLMCRLMDKPNVVPIPSGHSNPGDVREWYADISKICGIGFQSRTKFEEGLAKTIQSLGQAS